MKIWIFTTKEPLEYMKLDEDEEIKRSSTDKAKKGDIILIYQGNPYSNIQYIFKAKNDAYQDKTFRDDWETAIDLEDKVELKNPLTINEMKDDPILGQFGVVRKNFMGSFFEVPPKELKRFKTLILEKNSEIADDVNQLLSDHKTEKEDVNGISNSNGSECINDNHRGRAHITRDVCYLAHKNPNITDKDLINLIIDQVGDNQDYWEAHYQKCLPENCIKYNIESARSLGLVNCNKFELTDKGLELINQLENNELFTYHYSIGTKRFFYKLAQEDESIKTAMEIVKKEERLRFWSPTCERTKKVIEKYHQDNNKFVCEENKHPECTECDHDILKHIDQTSIVLETLKRTGKYSGFVFWFTSRVTPMHLTGKEPQYQGQHILWDQHEEDIIVGSKGKITDFLNYISRNYVRARENKERVKGHKLSLLFNKKFPQYLANLSNSLINDDRHYYKSGSGYHARGRFIRHPWVFSRGWNKSNYVSYVLYIFEEDMSGFYLSLNLPWGYANQVFEENPGWNKDERGDYLKSCASTYKNKLESDVGIPVEFEEDIVNSPWWNTTILGKYYSFKNLPSENELEQDLKKILILSNSLETEIPRSYQIIQKLFKEYQDTFLETEVGVEHSNKYDLERQKVHQYFEIIQSDAGVNQIEDPPINYLLPIKEPSIAPVAVGDIRAFGYKNEDLPGLTVAVRDLLANLIQSDDKEEKKDLIATFKKGKYKKGFRTAMLTPTLYYLEPNFWFINRKTVATFNLFSQLLGDNDKISVNLEDYIENNDKVHNLAERIREYIPELDFETFDEFCHWMCDKSLGNYAMDTDKFNDWLLKNFPQTLINIQFDSFNDYLTHKNFLYSPEIIENFLLSLKVKPLVILTGNSGTGKTKIAQLFGDYLKTKNNGNYLIIPVGANWTENRHLLGFYNVIIQDYQSTDALEFLLRASNDPLKPYFLILDEMNLSHVERYFADFLSAMESGENIPLHSHVDLKEPLLVPNYIKIPENVFVVGTVNVDETTYMFSPKVLDRANTIEFPTYPAKDYILGHNKDNNFDGNLEFLENPLSDLKIRNTKVEKLKRKLKNVMIPDDNLWTHLAKEIHQFQEILAEAGFDFGFRVIDEILRFIYVSWVYEGSPTEFNNWSRYFDAQIMQKMLPKIHGSQRELDLVLEKLFKKCYRGEYDSTWHEVSMDPNHLVYPYSAEKLQKMGKTLQKKRFVSFTD